MHFDGTITLGSLIAMAGIVLTIIGVAFTFDRRVNKMFSDFNLRLTGMERDVKLMWNVFKKKFNVDDNGDDNGK